MIDTLESIARIPRYAGNTTQVDGIPFAPVEGQALREIGIPDVKLSCFAWSGFLRKGHPILHAHAACLKLYTTKLSLFISSVDLCSKFWGKLPSRHSSILVVDRFKWTQLTRFFAFPPNYPPCKVEAKPGSCNHFTTPYALSARTATLTAHTPSSPSDTYNLFLATSIACEALHKSNTSTVTSAINNRFSNR